MIRHAKPADHAAIREINIAAFGKPDEADLVERLRADGDKVFELVADEDGVVVGHIFYSRLWADSVNMYAALAPMAVRPDLQRSGVGSRLVKASLDTAREFAAAPASVSRIIFCCFSATDKAVYDELLQQSSPS